MGLVTSQPWPRLSVGPQGSPLRCQGRLRDSIFSQERGPLRQASSASFLLPHVHICSPTQVRPGLEAQGQFHLSPPGPLQATVVPFTGAAGPERPHLLFSELTAVQGRVLAFGVRDASNVCFSDPAPMEPWLSRQEQRGAQAPLTVSVELLGDSPVGKGLPLSRAWVPRVGTPG